MYVCTHNELFGLIKERNPAIHNNMNEHLEDIMLSEIRQKNTNTVWPNLYVES